MESPKYMSVLNKNTPLYFLCLDLRSVIIEVGMQMEWTYGIDLMEQNDRLER